MSIAIDVAIIGGGSAGMSLAANLATLDTGQQVRIFEPNTTASRECHWGLWANASQYEKLRPAIKGHWQGWQLVDHRHQLVKQSDNFTYTSLSSSRYLNHCENLLHGSVQLIRAAVDDVEHQADGALLTAAGETFQTAHIFDSRPPRTAAGGLIQHFVGREIRTQQPLPNVGIATLMDFRVDQSRGLHFIYALPFSKHHLLVESTMISRSAQPESWYTDAIDAWLDDRGICMAEQLALEVGCIPMDSVYPQDPRHAAIGAAGGALRRSSGYAFSYIQQQTRQLAERIASGQYEVPQPISQQLLYMDGIFNRVLIEYPELGVSLFMDMAAALSGEQFARFMLGQASLMDWARVISAMPKGPFLRQLLDV